MNKSAFAKKWAKQTLDILNKYPEESKRLPFVESVYENLYDACMKEVDLAELRMTLEDIKGRIEYYKERAETASVKTLENIIELILEEKDEVTEDWAMISLKFQLECAERRLRGKEESDE